ncbi:MAG TPA: thioredoxin domain-containing protein, partial [Rugosimonospora sp.]|nr:thioredoxin domain-containing protein [Rugosimonospora sp.]
MNRLGGATSPYLLQHADNPVDWWPWSPGAFAEAKRRDVPLLISVGYAACHWCHVMAHESFENAGIAELINRDFVAIKVDREERPDVDAVYMTATQAMTGQGGWPMTVFATPDGQPFFCGTYFPPPAFTRLLGAVSQAWRDEREAVLQQGGAVVEAIGQALGTGGGPAAPLSAEVLDAAAAGLAGEFDEVHGGFGGAPKFPPHLSLLFLLRHHQRTGDARTLEIVRHTAEQMARGGIYDQVGGGFARYSVDERWVVPHFEKMLYDNALLLRAYTQVLRLTGDALARRVALGTAEFMRTELATAEGGFASSLDADAAGAEGSTYVWTPAQLREVLGEEDGAFAADLFGVTAGGTFEHGTSVLRLMRDLDAAAPNIRERAASVVDRLRAARAKRPQPGRDDKVVAAWNGLAITALVDLSRTVPDAVDDDDVVRAAELLAGTHMPDGRLRRVSRAGVVGEPAGVLDDYGCVAEAFCAVHELTGEGRWLELAGRLLDAALAHFADGRGGFFDTADDAEQLVTRPADPTDNATPSGLSAIAAALTRYAALSGEPRYRAAAEEALATVAALADRHPRFAGYACAVGEALLSGPYEIAVV